MNSFVSSPPKKKPSGASPPPLLVPPPAPVAPASPPANNGAPKAVPRVPLGDNLTVTGLQILRMEGNMAEVGGVLVGSPADIDGIFMPGDWVTMPDGINPAAAIGGVMRIEMNNTRLGGKVLHDLMYASKGNVSDAITLLSSIKALVPLIKAGSKEEAAKQTTLIEGHARNMLRGHYATQKALRTEVEDLCARHEGDILQLRSTEGGKSDRMVELLEKKCAQLTFKVKQQQEAMTNMQVKIMSPPPPRPLSQSQSQDDAQEIDNLRDYIHQQQARLSAAEELAKRSTSLQAEVSSLKQQLDEVRSNSDRVILEQEKQAFDYERELETLKAAIESKAMENQKNSNTYRMQAQINDLEMSLAEMTKDLDASRSEASTLRTKVAGSEGELVALRQMTGMLGEQLIAAKEKLEDTRDMATEAHSMALEEARAEALQAQGANSTMRAELDRVMKDREAAYAARDAAVAKAQKVQQEAESLRQGLDRFQDEALLKMRQSLKEVEGATVEAQRQAKMAADASMRDITNKLRDSEAREKGLEERVILVSREKEATDLKVSTLERRLVECEKEAAMRKQNEEVLSGYVQTLREDLTKSYASSIRPQDMTNRLAEKQLHDAEKDDLRSKITSLAKQLEQTASSKEWLESQVLSLQNEMGSMGAASSTAPAGMSPSKAEILQDVIAAGERQVEEQRRELASMQAEEASATENSAEGPPRPLGSDS